MEALQDDSRGEDSNSSIVNIGSLWRLPRPLPPGYVGWRVTLRYLSGGIAPTLFGGTVQINGNVGGSMRRVLDQVLDEQPGVQWARYFASTTTPRQSSSRSS